MSNRNGLRPSCSRRLELSDPAVEVHRSRRRARRGSLREADDPGDLPFREFVLQGGDDLRLLLAVDAPAAGGLDVDQLEPVSGGVEERCQRHRFQALRDVAVRVTEELVVGHRVARVSAQARMDSEIGGRVGGTFGVLVGRASRRRIDGHDHAPVGAIARGR